MRAKPIWTLQSFISCFFWNAVLVAVFFFISRQILQGLHQWVDPLLTSTTLDLPEDVKSALISLDQFLNETGRYLAPVVFGTGALVTFVLWLFVLFQGRGLANRAQREASPGRTTTPPGDEKEDERRITEAPIPESPYVQPSPQAAVQMLSILQREGRLIDFLQEDLSLYDDAQIGAAVRNVHQGCKGALLEYAELEPIFEEGEGVEVMVPSGFDSRAIRLTGDVSGDPPFRGTLRHRGWRVARLQLPQTTMEQKKDWVLAPAEVEIG